MAEAFIHAASILEIRHSQRLKKHLYLSHASTALTPRVCTQPLANTSAQPLCESSPPCHNTIRAAAPAALLSSARNHLSLFHPKAGRRCCNQIVENKGMPYASSCISVRLIRHSRARVPDRRAESLLFTGTARQQALSTVQNQWQ